MQKKERLMTVVGTIGVFAIAGVLTALVLCIGTASARLAIAAQDELIVESEPEMMAVEEAYAVEAEAEEPEAYVDMVEPDAELEEVVEATDEVAEIAYWEEPTFYWDGSVLNAFDGTNEGPSGHETYYNKPMDGVLYLMETEEGISLPYWVRDDGVKMFGDYVMVAANLNIRPKGTILETSRGTGMVCDTGTFADINPYQLDIAVTW